MAAVNNDPIYSKVGEVSYNAANSMSQTISNAANDFTGVSTLNSLVFTADSTNGGFIQRIRFKAVGTNAASVARVFLNNGLTNGTASNNAFYGEISLPATTLSSTSATSEIDYPMNFAINPLFRIYFGLATAVSAGWVAVGIGGRY